jgi:DNA replication protein DnaC
MGFNRENYKRIKEEYDGKYLRAMDEARERKSEVHLQVDGVAEIDRLLSTTGPRIFELSIKGQPLDAVNAENKLLLKRRAALLTAAGYPADYTDLKYECDECGDTGVVDNRMCKCMRRKLVEAGFQSSGMYDLIKKQSFDNFDLKYYEYDRAVYDRMKKISEILKKYAEEFDAEKSGNIAMFGKTGLGKTHLSSAMAGVIIEKGNDVYYAGAMNMFADFEYKRFGNSASPDAEGDIEKYFSCDLLIIDDLGTEVNNQFTTSCLYNVIESRLNRGRPTVISTNLTQDEFRKRYWDRIASRIFGEYQILPFIGNDVRERKIRK